jgi:1-aminocyclopropane-1-carboxylate deaminase/D-cysteine desulfhydrase-like pyridoxal-dependent ACC family enzyme
MNFWFEQFLIPTDFVYTGKLFFAVNDLLQKKYFKEGSKVLVIHSGGLQGNRSLPKRTLIFPSN